MHRPGEVSERSKERAWKARRRDLSPRGFKSLSLRCTKPTHGMGAGGGLRFLTTRSPREPGE